MRYFTRSSSKLGMGRDFSLSHSFWDGLSSSPIFLPINVPYSYLPSSLICDFEKKVFDTGTI